MRKPVVVRLLAIACDVRSAAIIIFIVSLAVGGIFSMWPGSVAKHDIQMSPFFATPEAHRAFIKGCGFILFCLAAASLLAALFP